MMRWLMLLALLCCAGCKQFQPAVVVDPAGRAPSQAELGNNGM